MPNFPYQKDVYLIINGMIENNVRVSPENILFRAKELFAGNTTSNNITDSDIDADTRYSGLMSRVLDFSTNNGLLSILNNYDVYKSDNTLLDLFPYNFAVLKENSLGLNTISEEKILVREYEAIEDEEPITDRLFRIYKRGSAVSYYGSKFKVDVNHEDAINEARSELSEYKFDIHSLQKMNEGYFEWNNSNESYSFISNKIHHTKIGTFDTKPNIGFTFNLFNENHIHGFRNRRTSIDDLNTKIQGIIVLEPFFFIIYGTPDDIEFVHLYQRDYSALNNFIRSNENNSIYLSNDEIDSLDGIVKNTKLTYCHTFVSDTKNYCKGITFVPLPNGNILIKFNDKINSKNIGEERTNSFRIFGNQDVSRPEGLSSYQLETSHGVNHRRDVYVSTGTRFLINPIFHLKSTNSSINKNLSTVANKIHVYWNFEYYIHMLIAKPLFNSDFMFRSNDRTTGLLISNEQDRIILNNENSARTGLDTTSYIWSDYEGSYYRIIHKKFVKNYSDSVGNQRIIIGQEQVRNENQYTDTTDIQNASPRIDSVPVYKLVIHMRYVPPGAPDTFTPSLNYCNIPFLLDTIVYKNPGIFVPGTLRKPSKIVIKNEDILSLSVSRGSLFDEHASVTIKNEDGKYDYIKNLSSYNAMIALDMTDEYEQTGSEFLRFINDISAQELGIPERSVIIFRGVSDFEIPINYVIEKLDTCNNVKLEKITLNIKGMGHLISQMVPLVVETFNFYTHIQAIERILFKAGFGDQYLDTNRNHPDANVRLQPPIPNFSNGWVIEPPNNFGDFTRKICNEFSGWTLSYNPHDGRFKYFPRNSFIPNHAQDLLLFLTDEKSYLDNYSLYPFQTFKVIDDINVKVTRPIATQILLYGGTVYPTMRTDYITTNIRAVEDPNYEWYIGKNIPVFVYVNHIQPKVLEMILKDLSFRLLLGHKYCNITYVGFPLKWLAPCYIQGVGYGIVKNGTFNYDGVTKIMTGDYEIELVNYVYNENAKFVFWFDEI